MATPWACRPPPWTWAPWTHTAAAVRVPSSWPTSCASHRAVSRSAQGGVVVPGQPVRALVDAAGPLLAVNHEYAGGADHQMIDVRAGVPGHGEVVEDHVAVAGEPVQQAGGASLPGGAQRHPPDKRAGPGDQLLGTAPSGSGQG